MFIKENNMRKKQLEIFLMSCCIMVCGLFSQKSTVFAGETNTFSAFEEQMEERSRSIVHPEQEAELEDSYDDYHESGDWVYRVLADGTVEASNYYGKESQVVIPFALGGKNVSSIGGVAFSGNETVTSVEIPSSVTNIESSAFTMCSNLSEINLPEGLKSIGAYAFDGTQIRKVDIPASVTYIGDGAFSNCKNLMQINVDGDNSFYISENNILMNKDRTKLIQVPAGLSECNIPSQITSIGGGAFYGCEKITNLQLPSGLTEIGAMSFCSSGLQSVEIPQGITELGENAFLLCLNLTEFNVSENNPNYSVKNGVLLNREGNTLILYPAGRDTIEIPSGVTKLNNLSFYSCSKLTGNITIPATIHTIGEACFSYCTGITGVEIPASVGAIGAGAFQGCSSLKSVQIPASIEKIDRALFSNCVSLSNISIPTSVRTIDIGAFYRCSSLKNITIPSGVTQINDSVFSECTSLTSITIPAGVGSIGNFSFSECISLKSVKIPSGVSKIGEMAFYGCKNLSSVVIPSSVKTFGSSVFSDCGSSLVLSVTKGSKAETYALENRVKYCYTGKESVVFDPDHTHNIVEKITPATTKKDGKVVWSCKSGDYSESAKLYRIKKVQVLADNLVYTGKNIKPSVQAIDSKGNEITSDYYTVTYKNNKKMGTATASVKFKKFFSGTVKVKFDIVPKGTKSTSINYDSQKKKAYIFWKKQSSQTSGYEVWVSQDSKYKSAKKKTINNPKATKSELSIKLNVKKNTYVRIRTFKKVGKKKYYSSWDDVYYKFR